MVTRLQISIVGSSLDGKIGADWDKKAWLCSGYLKDTPGMIMRSASAAAALDRIVPGESRKGLVYKTFDDLIKLFDGIKISRPEGDELSPL
jgi:hypothetical protein